MAKTRRTFTPEFKAEAVKLVTERARASPRSPGTSTSARACCGAGSGPWPRAATRPSPARATRPPLEEELRRLRAEDKRLTMERDILPLNASIARPSFSPDSSPKGVFMPVRT